MFGRWGKMCGVCVFAFRKLLKCEKFVCEKLSWVCPSVFFNKVAGVRTATLLKKRLWPRCFPVTFAKFLRTSFFIEQPLVADSE